MQSAGNPPHLGSDLRVPVFLKVQRIFFAICMVLPFPLLIVGFVTAGNLNPANGNIAIANVASMSLPPFLDLALVTIGLFLLPFGFLGMVSLAMSRSPWLASIGGVLSLIGMMTTIAFAAQSDMTYDMAQLGSSPQFIALWNRFNSDTFMTACLILFIIGFVGGPLLLGIALGRARAIPLWAAAAIVLSRLLPIIAFPAHLNSSITDPVSYGLFLLGSIPAAFAMLKLRKEEESAPKNR
ncbi:MAG: hypothetical protein IMW90_22190 [Thermogemmatispora sp.]|jgi:hypothetical protein|uniref:DUF4386 domain-containing protein n=1 Tax=Thermogemmatispora aurantia TaxID=2045279 RepID=A0A5J4K693_9CHLR|nr:MULTISPECIES: hypothetical protein [Thermogemmatispora]MBE3568435.1 hypothetical protein [Thermogemmatispora sp.]GER82199.1 hypothetical protein KTAU_08370 [Thermogemmatispora aurantia]